MFYYHNRLMFPGPWLAHFMLRFSRLTPLPVGLGLNAGLLGLPGSALPMAKLPDKVSLLRHQVPAFPVQAPNIGPGVAVKVFGFWINAKLKAGLVTVPAVQDHAVTEGYGFMLAMLPDVINQVLEAVLIHHRESIGCWMGSHFSLIKSFAGFYTISLIRQPQVRSIAIQYRV